MKFSNGNWLKRDGMQVLSPCEAYDIESDADSFTVYAPCKCIQTRGNTLDGLLLTIRFSSPLPDVIRVQVHHFKGVRHRGPEFALTTQPHRVEITNGSDAVVLRSGRASVSVSKSGAWAVDFFSDNVRLTGSSLQSLAYIKTDQSGVFMRDQLSLGVGEHVYGLGERFTSFIKNGQVVDIWNEDGGTGTEQAYKNIPFYMTNRGYGVLVNHPERVSFEVGSERVSKVQFSVSGESLDYMVIAGPSPKQVLKTYTDLTGKPALPPAWSFGLWLSTSFTTNYDEVTVSHFVDEMKSRDIPLHVFHFDCFWMKEFEWSNFVWDDRVFPDPEGMLERLKSRGLRVCVWINPYIAQKSRLFDDAAEKGFLLKRANGDVWQWDLWQSGMGIVDFTNPAASQWFSDQLRPLLAMGVDAFKTDFGERIPTDVVYHDGSDPHKMHNYYPFLYNKVVHELLTEQRGQHEAVVFARSATVGGQQFPVHWGGDCNSDYESMAESLRGGLSLGLSGFGFWSHDIGGFENTSTPDVYKRWAAFGLLSSHSRLHGSTSYRVPWLFDDEAVDVVRHFVRLKCRLMPYLFAAAVEAHRNGVPMMRPMLLEFPDDETCGYLDRQYMLGESILVAPIFRADSRVSYYLPQGTWTHFLTGQTVPGGTWRTDNYDYLSLPLFIRANAVIPVGSKADTPDYDYADGVTFHVFALGDVVSTAIPIYNTRGELDLTLHLTKQAATIRFRVTGGNKPWQILLRGGQVVKRMNGGSCTVDESGVTIQPHDGRREVSIELE